MKGIEGMEKRFFGDFKFNSIEIDISKGIYRIDGKDVGRRTESIHIDIEPFEVYTRITTTLIGEGKKKTPSAGTEEVKTEVLPQK